jgi:hypothetical protein
VIDMGFFTVTISSRFLVRPQRPDRVVSTGGTSLNSTVSTEQTHTPLWTSMPMSCGPLTSTSESIHPYTRAEIPGFHHIMPNDRRAVNATGQTGVTRIGAVASRRL